MKSLSVVSMAFLVLLASCGKESASSGNGNTPPSNLLVNAVVNPDNSGNVSFTASATNAVSYIYDFGNGNFQTVPSGIVTYRYPVAGSYSVAVTARSASGQAITKSIPVTVTIALALVWSDEFNTDGAPDPAKWGYNIGTGTGGWGNNELQYYTDRADNVIVEGGFLKVKAKKESFSGNEYTSARLLSQAKFAFKYGRVEVSAKLPAGVGTWPAIWMLGSNINTVSWPACGEIDIMEHRGSDLNKIHGTLHYPGRFGGSADGSTKLIANASTEFHKYSLEWSASTIKIFADDQLFHTVANSSSLPFNQDFFFIINVAMGGSFGGAVDPAFSSATMEVDYIRVYQ
jgi:beta-glucanase (GH16 family)